VANQLKGDPEFIATVTPVVGDSGGGSEPIDYGELVQAVLRRLPPITVQFMGDEGVVADSVTIYLGGNLKIPPVVLQKFEGGKRFWQVKPLGEPLNLELVPVE